MRKNMFFIIFSISISFMARAQNENRIEKDSILLNDIYSNFNKDQYTPSKGFTILVNKAGDTIKLLSNTYESTIIKGDNYYKKADFASAVKLYITAFENNHRLGKVEDRYKVACCYSMLNNFDSAFFQLERIVTTGKYYQNEEIENEKLLKPLHKDKRWPIIIAMVIKNKTDLKNQLDAAIEQ